MKVSVHHSWDIEKLLLNVKYERADEFEVAQMWASGKTQQNGTITSAL